MTCQNVEFPLLETFIKVRRRVLVFLSKNMWFQSMCLKYFVGSILSCRQVALMNKSIFCRQVSLNI